jgi:hypothetical protein
MEYLPEKKRTQQTQILKHERKIHDFREYLCDSEVVLAIVKCKFILSPLTFIVNRFACSQISKQTTRRPPTAPARLLWKLTITLVGQYGRHAGRKCSNH